MCISSSLLSKRNGLRILWEIAIYSIILPDNYSTIILMAIPAIMEIARTKRLKNLKSVRISVALSVLLSVAILTTLIHFVPFINVIVSLVFLSSAIFAVMMIRKGSFFNSLVHCEHAFDRVIRIEIIATIVNILMLLVGKKYGDDWSTGTFGIGQQSQIFLLFAMYLIVMIAYYKVTKRKKYLAYGICAVLCLLSTRCWAQLGLYVVFVFIGYVTTVDRRIVKRILISIFLGIVLIASVGKTIYRSSIGQQVVRIIYEQDYRSYRAGKVTAYVNTFITIPRKDIFYFLFGNGIGWYASRGALTCSGAYVSVYNSYFHESMSAYTKEYIYPGLLRAYNNGSSDYGSIVARPYSTIISIMGEVGMVGLVTFFCIFIKISKKYGRYARLVLMAWLSSCFAENYLEYSKIIIVLLFCLCLVNMLADNNSSEGCLNSV